MLRRPYCMFCRQNGHDEVPATLLGAQSEDRGRTVSWVAICDTHADGWNEGGDWEAPLFVLVERSAFDALAAKVAAR